MPEDFLADNKISSSRISPIKHSEGIEMAKDIGALKYLECSALTKVGIQGVFTEIARAGLTPRAVKRRDCVIV